MRNGSIARQNRGQSEVIKVKEIVWDDYLCTNVGRSDDGRQYWLFRL